MSAPARMCASAGRARAGGFTLIEVLVALIILGVGLLGVGKIQALAYSTTTTSALRSIAAIEAASLASSMRVDRAYWANGSAPVPITVAGTTITSADATLAAAANCTQGGANAPCTPHDLAAYDLQQWAASINATLPNVTATVSCPVLNPINCTIQISWNEHVVAVNAQGAAGPALALPTYTLSVEP